MKLRLGIIGVGGHGAKNLAAVSGERIAALCDVDAHRLAHASATFPEAAVHTDFRRMLEREALDAVVISTPDHTHAVAAVMAMRAGKHVYCEKPLARTVAEARAMTHAAAECGVVTQMGNQTHSSPTYRRAVELVRAGVIGEVREVHAWTSLAWTGAPLASQPPPPPSGLAWDLWLGPARERPYDPTYVPFHWRGWWAFGTGSLGDLGCHLLDPAFRALGLRSPRTVKAEGPAPDEERTPPSLVVRWTFPQEGGRPDLPVVLYHGDRRPPEDLFEGASVPSHAVFFQGKRGGLLVNFSGGYTLLPEAEFDGFEEPASVLPAGSGHHAEWIAAIQDGGSPGSRFAYAGPLTEAVLLGNVAHRLGRGVTWDTARCRAVGDPEADRFLHVDYREGWSL